MALPGELKGFSAASCCNVQLKLNVCHSNAGYYLGYICQNCGPYSRETGYMTDEAAEEALKRAQLDPEDVPLARDTKFKSALLMQAT